MSGWMRPEPALGPAKPDPRVKVRQAGRIVSGAVIIATAVNADGRREALGMDIGPSEAETFWTEFLRKLARRGGCFGECGDGWMPASQTASVGMLVLSLCSFMLA
jgi:hypothetical protein